MMVLIMMMAIMDGVRRRKKVVVSLTLDVINLFRRKDERRVQKVYQTREKNHAELV